MYTKKRTQRTKVYILYGPAGTGKTFTAGILAKQLGYTEDQVYDQDSTAWWQNYTGQPFVVVDEFEGQWQFTLWKKVCDYRPLQVPNKGGYQHLLAEVIVFTTNKHPHSWYNVIDDEQVQFDRRVDSMIRFNKLVQLEDRWILDREAEIGPDLPLPKEGEGFFWQQ